MDDRIRRLRTEAHQLARGKVPRAIRYPAAFRAAAVALAGPRLERGGSIARVARDLGLPIESLGRWLRLPPAAGQGAAVGRHRAVHLRQAPGAGALRVPVA